MPARRAGATIAHTAKIVNTLFYTSNLTPFGKVLLQTCLACGNIINYPVGKGANGRIWVIHNEHKGLGVAWLSRPFNLRRYIFSITSIFARYILTFFERSFYLHGFPPKAVINKK